MFRWSRRPPVRPVRQHVFGLDAVWTGESRLPPPADNCLSAAPPRSRFCCTVLRLRRYCWVTCSVGRPHMVSLRVTVRLKCPPTLYLFSSFGFVPLPQPLGVGMRKGELLVLDWLTRALSWRVSLGAGESGG